MKFSCAFILLCLFLAACGSDSSNNATAELSSETSSAKNSSSSIVKAESSNSQSSSDNGVCTSCDNFTAADPVLTKNGGYGSITTYGSISAKETSFGGACNYGQTNIQYYAAIHVNVSPGDNLGPWQGGAICGACVRVKARTPEGFKEVTVRITDRCPDANCGVDLGGAPAYDIMGEKVGRYSGEWEFVSCENVKGVWGDSTSVFVKEGASAYWSIIQVRNPKDAVKEISIVKAGANDLPEALKFATEAENFWTVPKSVLQNDSDYLLQIQYRSGAPDTLKIKGSELALGNANYYI